MATRSFTDTYIIEPNDVGKFHNIMNSKKTIKVKNVKGHKDVKGNAILKMLRIEK